MAKELPFFKFEPSQWDNGNIQLCSFEAKGVFISVCSMYWQRLGEMPYKLAVQKICNGNATALDSLIEADVLKIIDGLICIDFLNEQLSEFETISNTNSENARSGWEKRRLNATASRKESDRNAIKGEKRKEDKTRVDDNKANGAANAATCEQRKEVFMKEVAEYLPIYGKEMLREFFDYWTEANKGGKKMRFEMQKVFELSKRLKTWSNRQNGKFNGKTGIEGVINKQQRLNDLIEAEFADNGTTAQGG